MAEKAKHGLTLVELLVVIAIIGILIALLVPAVQAIREVARRNECLSKQRSIAVALQQHQTIKGKFPRLAYGEYDPVSGLVDQPVWSWTTRILVYMELGNVFDILQPGDGASGNTAEYVFDEANISQFREILDTPLPAFRCVTDNPPEQNSIRWFYIHGSDPTIEYVASSSYVASNSCGREYIDDTGGNVENPYGTTYGTSSSVRAIEGHGIFGSMRKGVSTTDISDGLSNTILIGERAWEYGPRSNRQRGRAALLYAGRIMTVFGYAPGIGSRIPPHHFGASDLGGSTAKGLNPIFEQSPSGTPPNEWTSSWTAADSYSSSHRGGVNLAFADGSVKFMPTGTDHVILGRLANYADGQVVESN